MKVLKTQQELDAQLETLINKGVSIGFVPTMGALHEGHMALIQRAKKENEVVFSSVFVNPTQFNNSEDLKLYPRTPEKDAELLEANGCDFAFFPSVDVIYPENLVSPVVHLGNLERVMEGHFRPGHFQGVVQVVARLFDLIKPTRAYFGLKDFQQVAVIQHMVKELKLPVEIVPSPTLRENSGLAMSSRNMRLSSEERVEALHIFETMKYASGLTDAHIPSEVSELAKAFFAESSMELEYLSIVHPLTLEELTTNWVKDATICIACYCGPVRLIDNMQFPL